MPELTVLELCSGAGGQALGLEQAGFAHVAAIDNDFDACTTLRRNRPGWKVLHEGVEALDGREFRGVDLVAGGVPCPPFSIAGKQLGKDDERDLFPDAIRIVDQARPTAVMIENVRGLMTNKFKTYRANVLNRLAEFGYFGDWRLLNACDFGVPQLRPRSILVAMRREAWEAFSWPTVKTEAPTVGEVLLDLMAARGWTGAKEWAKDANDIAPTLVGGSKKHGGPDLGPTRAREKWRSLRVDGLGVADLAPDEEFALNGTPRLTPRMLARIQGFPDDWLFSGRKTAACRQIGNAFPPPVARVAGEAIASALATLSHASPRRVRSLALAR